MIIHAIFAILSYLLGSIPTGLLLARIKGIDIRKAGSGNIGFSNVMRVVGKDRQGKILGLLTLLGDMGKGALAVRMGILYGHSLDPVIAGLFVFLGHLFSFWLRGRGGKGVATGLGVALGIDPLFGLVICLPWLLLYLATRTASVASLGSFALMPLVSLFWTRIPSVSRHFLPEGATHLFFIMTALVFLRHWDNIIRILSNNENKL
ncbi:MAG: hypothetical protein D084_Lepto4C00454G0001 [Leptospirillum sp. Group IV 'UBA BS']|nr:MAG: hypothetical protein D084_Lepto4C00454G0001 [Leptospirillum sp. Group IV 'UBA BS']